MTSLRYDCLYKEGNNVIILHATSKLRKIDLDMSFYNINMDKCIFSFQIHKMV